MSLLHTHMGTYINVYVHVHLFVLLHRSGKVKEFVGQLTWTAENGFLEKQGNLFNCEWSQ